MLIRYAVPSDEPLWRSLWEGYLAFYETDLSDTVTAHTWARLIRRDEGMFCRIAEVSGQVCGFSHSVLHAGTWVTQPICYLEDLFVAPEHRGHGIGGALIRDLKGLAGANGWSRLYWHTRSSNSAARRVYDRFAEADGFVRYRLSFKDPA